MRTHGGATQGRRIPELCMGGDMAPQDMCPLDKAGLKPGSVGAEGLAPQNPRNDDEGSSVKSFGEATFGLLIPSVSPWHSRVWVLSAWQLMLNVLCTSHTRGQIPPLCWGQGLTCILTKCHTNQKCHSLSVRMR